MVAEAWELAVGTGAAELLVTLVDATTDDEAEAGLVDAATDDEEEAGLVDTATDDEEAAGLVDAATDEGEALETMADEDENEATEVVA